VLSLAASGRIAAGGFVWPKCRPASVGLFGQNVDGLRIFVLSWSIGYVKRNMESAAHFASGRRGMSAKGQ
jgi:hypothetical protein